MTLRPEFDGHGWAPPQMADRAIHVGRLPGRVSVCLYEMDYRDGGAAIRPLAYFKTAEAAQTALDVLDALVAWR